MAVEDIHFFEFSFQGKVNISLILQSARRIRPIVFLLNEFWLFRSSDADQPHVNELNGRPFLFQGVAEKSVVFGMEFFGHRNDTTLLDLLFCNRHIHFMVLFDVSHIQRINILHPVWRNVF